MIDTNQVFVEEYITAFSAYLADRQEVALGHAYELGRAALGFQSGLFMITAAHHEALHKALRDAETTEQERIVKQAAEFLAECLSPFEMAQRGFQEAIIALNSLNQTLHRQESDLHLLLSPMPNLLLTVDNRDCLAAILVPPRFPPILKLQKMGTALADALPDEIASQIMGALSAVRRSNQIHRLECPLTIGGQILYFDLQISPVAGSDDVLLVIDNITARKAIELAEQKQRILAEGLRDIAVALNSSLDLEEVLDFIVLSIGRVVPHDTANIMLVDQDGSAQIARSFGYTSSASKTYEKAITQLSIAPDTTPTLRRVIDSKQPVIVSDLDNKTTEMEHTGLGLHGSAVSVPIVMNGSIIGLINLNSFTPDFFSGSDAENLRIFANQAAVAIQNARLFEQAQEAAALNERQRLARDLHDSVNQSLFSASVIAESLPKLWKRNPDKVFPLLVDLHQLMKGTLAEMRLLLWELRPSSLIGNSLDKLLQQLVTAAQGQSKVTITINAEAVPQLPEDVHIVFYRIAQESLNNIIKHSQASKVTIFFSGSGNKTVLRLNDNGKGFDTSKTSTGLGLTNMRERARTIGAAFAVTSKPEKGTEVSLIWNSPPAREE